MKLKIKFCQKKWSEDIVDRYLSTKFGVNLLTVSEKMFFYRCTNDGEANDGRTCDGSISALK